jgi:hypothetical protein
MMLCDIDDEEKAKFLADQIDIRIKHEILFTNEGVTLD